MDLEFNGEWGDEWADGERRESALTFIDKLDAEVLVAEFVACLAKPEDQKRCCQISTRTLPGGLLRHEISNEIYARRGIAFASYTAKKIALSLSSPTLTPLSLYISQSRVNASSIVSDSTPAAVVPVPAPAPLHDERVRVVPLCVNLDEVVEPDNVPSGVPLPTVSNPTVSEALGLEALGSLTDAA